MIYFPIFIVFIASALVSSSCNADWEKVGESKKGNIFYVDLAKVRKQNRNIYWWQLINKKYGAPSVKFYIQADCENYRVKILSVFVYKKPMGEGEVRNLKPPEEWSYPPPNTPGEDSLKAVCKRAEEL